MIRYPLSVRLLHWSIAGLLLGMAGFGFYLTQLDYQDPSVKTLLQYHRTIGLLLFPLGLLHCVAYAMMPRPPLAEGMSVRQRRLAKAVHVFLLLPPLLIPLAGYFMSGKYLVLPGDWQVPEMIALSKPVKRTLYECHEVLAYLTVVIAVLHAAAAIKHHVVDKDDTLRKML